MTICQQANRWKKKGMSIVPMAWLLDVTGQFPVLVSIYHIDGTVVVSHGGIECGQGINTKVSRNVSSGYSSGDCGNQFLAALGRIRFCICFPRLHK